MRPITEREQSVLALISQGFSTRKIADALNISFNTVQTHRRSLLRKFDAINTAEMIRKATESNKRVDGEETRGYHDDLHPGDSD